jgi:hypothetical protein
VPADHILCIIGTKCGIRGLLHSLSLSSELSVEVDEPRNTPEICAAEFTSRHTESGRLKVVE